MHTDFKLPAHLHVTPAGQIPPVITTDQQLLAMQQADYMNSAQLAYFKGVLESQLAGLAAAPIQSAREDSKAEQSADPSDRASAEEAHSQALRTAARDSKAREDIVSAMGRIESGEYGWCIDTGDAIGLPRLLAHPTAELSVEAKQRREKQMKYFN